jgi:trans-aconitate methyltransferase
VTAVKKIDKLSKYKFGDFIRNLTNINSPRYWDKYFSAYKDYWRDLPYRYLRDVFPKECSFTLLDIGCALGDGCKLLKEYYPKAEVSGADYCFNAIDKARRSKGGIRFFLLDITKENPDKKYDYIGLVHILEHFNDPFPVLDRCLKFVNKAVIVMTPYCADCSLPRLYSRGEHRYLFNENTFVDRGYKSSVLKITEFIESVQYKYIIYKIESK